ncbi:putative mRNA capping enzyme large subunit-like protein [Seal parapoxvirus]|uniref:mRNA-capping enzyme catalytic subunit n=1 Tax=Seal parapoxvirus TaxID=187984 RepID=A0A1Z3GCT8_9POXV|nr:putative mRNA capping enzyme large subunit-like protein [Seal parapoxvirus]ASC55576.1 putative mRNA capping enzyme large subunit-like protein [Seal parapoxvirus]
MDAPNLDALLVALASKAASVDRGLPDDEVHHEVELVLVSPPLSTLASALKLASETESFILFTVTSLAKEDGKLRTRVPLSRVVGLDVKNVQLVNSINSIVWERKSLVEETEVCPGCLVRHSTERRHLFVDFKKYLSAIRVELVNLVRVRSKEVCADFKFKYFLGSGAQSKSSLLHALNHPKSRPSPTLEFEVVPYSHSEPRALDEAAVLKELRSMAKALFMASAESVFLEILPPPPIKTLMLQKQEIPGMNLEGLYAVSKTDGVPAKVLVHESGVYCAFSHLGYTIRYPVKQPPRCAYKLWCEAVRPVGERVWSLFVLFVEDQEPQDRVSSVAAAVAALAGVCDRAEFKAKRVDGPFSSASELADYISAALKTEPEGVVLFYSSGEQSRRDFKVKRDNTVDQTTNIVFRYMSSEPIVFGEGSTFLEFKRYSNDRGFPKEYGTGRIFLREDVVYHNNIYCIEFTSTHRDVGLKSVVVPVKFIGEFSQEGYLLRPRINKTATYFKNSSYYGNQHSVVLEHARDQLISVGDMFDENRLAAVGHTLANDAFRLNPDTQYFSNRRTRGPLGVLSNYVKTLMISLYCSKTFLNNAERRKVLAVDFGNGADLEKYFFGEIASMVATDPDTRAIDRAMERYNRLNAGIKSRYYKFNYIQETIRSDTYVESIRQVMYFGRFNIVDWQMAIHYSFHPRHFAAVMKNLRELTAPGCKVLITTMDGDYLSTLTSKVTFVINKNLQESENFMSVERVAEDQVMVYAPSTMAQPMAEYIVKRADITKLFADSGFDLVDHTDFETVIRRSRRFVEGVSRLETRPSTKNFFELNRNALEEMVGTDVEALLKRYVLYVFSKR